MTNDITTLLPDHAELVWEDDNTRSWNLPTATLNEMRHVTTSANCRSFFEVVTHPGEETLYIGCDPAAAARIFTHGTYPLAHSAN